MDVHVHANCQAIPIAGMLREAHPDWHVTWFEAHGPEIIEQFDQHCARIGSADVVLSQPIHRGYRSRDELSLDWVRDNLRSDATLIVFPSMHFTGHHPGLDALPLEGLPFLSNLLVAHLVSDGHNPEEAVRLLLSDELLSDDEIEAEIRDSLDEQKRRELSDNIDVHISPFIEARCRAQMMFHILNHPLRETAAFVANGILERLGFPRGVAVEGRDYQKETHIPPLPTIACFLRRQSNGTGPDYASELVLLPGYRAMTQVEYYTLIAERLATFPPGEVIRATAARWPGVQMLRRLAAQGSAIPGISRWLEA